MERPDAGDEVYVSYGRHSNDFLLVECKRSLGLFAD